MIKAWVDWEFQLYECKAGLFSYLLRKEGIQWSLAKYKFKEHLYDANLAELLELNWTQNVGEFLPNECQTARPNSSLYSGDLPQKSDNTTETNSTNSTLDEDTEDVSDSS